MKKIALIIAVLSFTTVYSQTQNEGLKNDIAKKKNNIELSVNLNEKPLFSVQLPINKKEKSSSITQFIFKKLLNSFAFSNKEANKTTE